LTCKLPQGIARTGEVCTSLHVNQRVPFLDALGKGCLENKRALEVMVLSDSLRVDTGMRYKPCVCTVVCLGLIYSYASSGIREFSSTFASAFPRAKHEVQVSEACTWRLCSSNLGLQNEIPPDLRRAKGVCLTLG